VRFARSAGRGEISRHTFRLPPPGPRKRTPRYTRARERTRALHTIPLGAGSSSPALPPPSPRASKAKSLITHARARELAHFTPFRWTASAPAAAFRAVSRCGLSSKPSRPGRDRVPGFLRCQLAQRSCPATGISGNLICHGNTVGAVARRYPRHGRRKRDRRQQHSRGHLAAAGVGLDRGADQPQRTGGIALPIQQRPPRAKRPGRAAAAAFSSS
jgi:hypothetical protein